MGEIHKRKFMEKYANDEYTCEKGSQNKQQSGKCKFKQQLNVILSSTKS